MRPVIDLLLENALFVVGLRVQRHDPERVRLGQFGTLLLEFMRRRHQLGFIVFVQNSGDILTVIIQLDEAGSAWPPVAVVMMFFVSASVVGLVHLLPVCFADANIFLSVNVLRSSQPEATVNWLSCCETKANVVLLHLEHAVLHADDLVVGGLEVALDGFGTEGGHLGHSAVGNGELRVGCCHAYYTLIN